MLLLEQKKMQKNQVLSVKIMLQFVVQFMIILQQLKLKKLYIYIYIFAIKAKKKKNSDIILFFPVCAFFLISTYTHHIFSLLAFDTLELELSLVLFFLRFGLCVRKRRTRRRKKERNEHCADVSREKKTFFSVRQYYKKRILMLLYAEKK